MLAITVRHEVLFWRVSDNSGIRDLGCAAFVHMPKEKRQSHLPDHEVIKIHIVHRSGLTNIHPPSSYQAIATKHMSNDGVSIPFQKKGQNEVYLDDMEVNKPCTEMTQL